MSLLFKREKMRILAEKTENAPLDRAVLSEYALLQVRLRKDDQALKAIQSLELKADYKQANIDHYLPWVLGIISANQKVDDVIVSNMLVWTLDIERIDTAISIAEFMINHELSLPDRFKSPTVGFIAESFANLSLKKPDAVSSAQFQQVYDLVDGRDMFAPVQSKLCKALGVLLIDDNPERAIELLNRALELDSKAGVKKLIANAEKNLAALQKAPV